MKRKQGAEKRGRGKCCVVNIVSLNTLEIREREGES